MPELRKDPVVGRWVIISTERGKRPHAFDIQKAKKTTGKKSCPFCPGHEDKTPPEIFSFRDPSTQPNTPGWEVRVIPNKFPALRVEGDMGKMGIGIYDRMNGIGAHEVIIETPEHDKDIYELSIEHLVKIFDACKLRLIDLERDNRFRYIMIFRNKGIKAGASLSHPHTQLIATPVTPKRIKEKLIGAIEYFNYKDRCIFCDIIIEEQRQNKRIVYENDHFISFCPFASRFPFETHILPKRHNPDYQSIEYDELQSFAEIMKTTLHKLKLALDNPQYNYMIITGPIRWPRRGYWTTINSDFHWHLEIIPRLTGIAGFEWGTGFYINPTIPEDAAKFMREMSV